jgi:hypothetical protein
MRSTPRSGRGSISLLRRSLCDTALPLAICPSQGTILDIFAEGEKVAVRHHFNGTQRGAPGSSPETWVTEFTHLRELILTF